MDQMNLDAWIGRQVRVTGGVSNELAAQAHATLGEDCVPALGQNLPPLWHWFAFNPDDPTETLRADGHPSHSDLLPPTRGQRRMWAGGSIRLRGPLKVGDPLERMSHVRSVTEKRGASGPLVFVTVDHAIYGPQGLSLEERQDIVYADIPRAFMAPKKRMLDAAAVETIEPSEALLFRFSALTFNAHRIHYDLAYATQVEKYPGLVVHGPLQASLLMRAAVRHKGRPPTFFDFKSIHPLFAGQPMDIALREDEGVLSLWTGQNGHQGMHATAIWEDTQ